MVFLALLPKVKRSSRDLSHLHSQTNFGVVAYGSLSQTIFRRPICTALVTKAMVQDLKMNHDFLILISL